MYLSRDAAVDCRVSDRVGERGATQIRDIRVGTAYPGRYIRVGKSESPYPSRYYSAWLGPDSSPVPRASESRYPSRWPAQMPGGHGPESESPPGTHTARNSDQRARPHTHTHTHTHTPGRRGGAGFPHATGRRARCAHSHPHTRARTDARTRTRTRTLTHTLTSRTRTLTLRTRTQYTHCTAAADAAPAGGNQGAVETAASARCEGIRVVSRRHPSRLSREGIRVVSRRHPSRLAKASESSREGIRVVSRRHPSHLARASESRRAVWLRSSIRVTGPAAPAAGGRACGRCSG